MSDQDRNRQESPRIRSILRGAFLAIAALPLFVTAPLYRRWHLRWGATDEEVRGAMPGDDVVRRASFNATRAITVDAPPRVVWRWIVQVGYRRAGFYSYDLLDNAGYQSADRILEQFQHPKVGDWMPMARNVSERTAFQVKSIVPNESLLWEKPDSTWSWKLIQLPGGRTRVVTRLKQRYAWESPVAALMALALLELGDFPMMRRMLVGIKERSERPSPNMAGRQQGE